MAVEILRGRMKRNIGTKIQRPGGAGWCAGAIGQQQRAGIVGDLGSSCDIGHLPFRIIGSFHPHQTGFTLAHDIFQFRQIAGCVVAD